MNILLCSPDNGVTRDFYTSPLDVRAQSEMAEFVRVRDIKRAGIRAMKRIASVTPSEQIA
jgi:hypothetical protein